MTRLEVDGSFRPPPWLRNGHIQSILSSLSVRRRWLARSWTGVLASSRELVLDCGEGVRLQAFHSARPPHEVLAPTRVAVLLHGWEGSADSLYVLSLAQELYARGFEVVRLNLRDHGETHHLNRELFHSCRLAEVIGAVRDLQRRFRGRALHLAGFSLGGNFMLRVAAHAGLAGLDLARVVAISPVLEPAATLRALEQGLATYHSYFVRKWMSSLMKKQAAWPQHYDFAQLRKLADLRRMTSELVRQFTEFESLEEYLSGYAITGARLAQLAVPSTIITALDDPIIPAADLERLAQSPALRVITTRHGGHCGFLQRLRSATWAERRAAAELDQPVSPGSASPRN